jgi:hypothetical protein
MYHKNTKRLICRRPHDCVPFGNAAADPMTARKLCVREVTCTGHIPCDFINLHVANKSTAVASGIPFLRHSVACQTSLLNGPQFDTYLSLYTEVCNGFIMSVVIKDM